MKTGLRGNRESVRRGNATVALDAVERDKYILARRPGSSTNAKSVADPDAPRDLMYPTLSRLEDE